MELVAGGKAEQEQATGPWCPLQGTRALVGKAKHKQKSLIITRICQVPVPILSSLYALSESSQPLYKGVAIIIPHYHSKNRSLEHIARSLESRCNSWDHTWASNPLNYTLSINELHPIPSSRVCKAFLCVQGNQLYKTTSYAQFNCVNLFMAGILSKVLT